MPLAQWILYIVIIAVTPVVLGGRWLVRRIKQSGRDEAQAQMRDDFVFDVATNHLPHVFDALTKIATKLEIELPEPPPIRFVPFDRAKK